MLNQGPVARFVPRPGVRAGQTGQPDLPKIPGAVQEPRITQSTDDPTGRPPYHGEPLMISFSTPERRERHAQLIAAWQTTRDSTALEALLADYEPLFRTQIGRVMRGQVLSKDHMNDLLQECAQALMLALEGFDPEVCPSIAPYLMRHVRGALLRYVLDFRSACRLGTSSLERKAYYAAQRMRIQRLTQGQEINAEAEAEVVARDSATPLTVARRAVESMSSGSIGLDDLAMEEQSCSGDILETQSIAVAMAAFERLVNRLPERTRTIVCATLLGHNTEGAIDRMAQQYDLTPRRVRQIQVEGLEMLRKMLKRENITAESIF